jgi:hypothetical protein
MGREQDGGPLGREGFDGWSGGDLRGFDLEDTKLGSLGTLVGGLIGFFAEGAFGQARTGLARGYELAGELDEIGGDLSGGGGFGEDRGLAEGDLVVEGEAFVVEGIDRRVEVGGGEALGEGRGDVFIETHRDGGVRVAGL